MKLCECGCGQPAPIAKKTQKSRGHIKGKPLRFVKGHHVEGENHPSWKGGNHITRAEKALGKPLPKGAQVHHHTPKELVICQNDSYHKFIHQRQRAFNACGHANWRKCRYCKTYDSHQNLSINGEDGNSVYHKKCAAKAERKRQKKKN